MISILRKWRLSAFEVASLFLVIAFWIFYGTLSFYNRIATDDYSMIALANHHGVLGGTIWFYFNWTGGIFCTLFQTISVVLVSGHRSLLLYNLFLLGFLSASLFLLTRQLTKTYDLPITGFQNFL